MRAPTICLVAAPLLAFPLSAATVTSNLDSGPGTLRAAIAAAPPGDTITFSIPTPGTITLTAGEIPLGKDVTISGPGAALLTISGNNASRIFSVAPAIQVTISGVTLANGRFAPPSPGLGQGGCIVSAGALTLSSCVVQSCAAVGANEGTVPATDGEGGGVAVLAGSLTVASCTFSSDDAIGGNAVGDATAAGNGLGGGIWLSPSAAAVTIADTTFRANAAVGGGSVVTGTACALGGGGGGGGLEVAGGSVTVERTTFDSNRAFGGSADSEGGAEAAGAALGGGYYQEGGAVALTNATFSGNSANGGSQGPTIGLLSTAAQAPSSSAARLGRDDSALARLALPAVLCVSGTGAAFGGGLGTKGGTSSLVHLTVAGNSVTTGTGSPVSSFVAGGGILVGGSATLASSIVAGNTAATGADFMSLSGTFASNGYNIISAPPGGVGFAPAVGDDIGAGTDPLLGPLAANGGLTETRAIAVTSPAKDAIPVPACGATEDQRGVARPQGPGCDIGAFELELAIAQVPALSRAGLLALLGALAAAGFVISRRRGVHGRAS